MIEIVVEIVLFLIVALIVGFGFGFLIAKSLKKEKKEVVSKGIVDEDCELILQKKDETIETLTRQLSLEEERCSGLKREHEDEVTAFLLERMDITQKYRNLLSKTKSD